MRFRPERELEEEGARAYVQVKDLWLEGDDLRFRTRKDGDDLRFHTRKDGDVLLGVTALIDAARWEPLPLPPGLLDGFAREVLPPPGPALNLDTDAHRGRFRRSPRDRSR